MTEKTAKKVLSIITEEVDVNFDKLKVTYDEELDNIIIKYKTEDAEDAHDVIIEALLDYNFYEADSDISGDKGIIYLEE